MKKDKKDKKKKKKKVILPQYINSPLNNPMINYKTYVMSKGEKLLVALLAFVAGGIAGLLFYGDLFMVDGERSTATNISNTVVFCVVGLFAIKLVIPIYVNSRLQKRKTELKQQFRSMLDALASSFSSGSNVQNAFQSTLGDLQVQYGDKEYIVLEMQEIIAATRQNIDIEVMLKEFADRSGIEDIQNFADVFSVCYRKGGNMSFVINQTHSVLTDKMTVSDEIETKLTSNKMQHNIMSVMPIALMAMLRLTNDTLASNFSTFIGVLVNTIAIGIFIVAYKYGNKICDIKE